MLPSESFMTLQSSPVPHHGFFVDSQPRPQCDIYRTVGDVSMVEQAQPLFSLFEENHWSIEVLPEKEHLKKIITFDDWNFGLPQCKEAYSLVCENGLESDNVVANHFITKFFKAGDLLNAIRVFSKLSHPDVFSWYGLLNAFLDNGKPNDVITTYYEMYQSGIQLDGHVFRVVLKACANANALNDGRIIHVHMVEWGIDSNIYAGSTLVDMYVKCGNMEDARCVFEDLPDHDLVTWSTLLAGYARHGRGQEGLELFYEMIEEGIAPNEITCISVLKACSSIPSLSQGRFTHAYIVFSGFEGNIYLVNTLIDMYASCGSFNDARNVFARVQSKDLGTWNVMIGACAQYGCVKEALHLFYHMQDQGPNPGLVTFVNVLKACTDFAELNEAMCIHANAIKHGFDSDIYIGSTLVRMYAKCESIHDARAVFDKLTNRNVVTWAVIISGYAECGLGMEAFILLEQLKEGGVIVDQGIMISLVKACTNTKMLMQGYIAHALALEYNLEYDVIVGNGLITMYMTCSSIMDASFLFNRLPMRKTMTWNALISGLTLPSDDHAQNAHKALTIFHEMLGASIGPDIVTFISILKVCSILSALNNGNLIHALALENDLQSNILVSNALINMYFKCGDLDQACLVFNKLSKYDTVTLNVMIEGFGKSGYAKQALLLFEKMQDDDIFVDEVTFISLLSACSHAGLVKEGCYYFKLMKWVYGIFPNVDHCNLMVDLMGRDGLLLEAEDFLHTMPHQTDVAGWMSLLTHCRNYVDVELGLQCFVNVNALDPQNASSYVLMSSIYSRSGMWIDAERLENLRRTTEGAIKKPAKACIEIGNKIHEFVVGDTCHPEINDVHEKLKHLIPLMKTEGYEPNLDVMLHSISDRERETALCGHSEKLAIAFGLINTCEGMSIRVSKNLRVCSDCHAAAKVISKIEKREIFIIDTYHIHRFFGGDCSCRDFF